MVKLLTSTTLFVVLGTLFIWTRSYNMVDFATVAGYLDILLVVGHKWGLLTYRTFVGF